MKSKSCLAAGILSAAALVMPAQAKVIDQSDIGFTVAHSAQVAASPEDVWKMLRTPDKWWSKDHSWSGDAANFWLDSQAGGCFCEKLPPAKPGGAPGSVQHAGHDGPIARTVLELADRTGPAQRVDQVHQRTVMPYISPSGSLISSMRSPSGPRK